MKNSQKVYASTAMNYSQHVSNLPSEKVANAVKPKIHYGPVFKNLMKYHDDYAVLSKEEERALIEKHKGNPDVMQKLLILHNIGLVFSISKKYAAAAKDYEEMISNGLYGLTVAASKFDPSKNIKFCTYATPWVFKYVVSEFYQRSNKIDFNSVSIFTQLGSLNSEDLADETFSVENKMYKLVSPDSEYAIDFAVNDNGVDHAEAEEVTDKLSVYVSTSSDFSTIDKTVYDEYYLKGTKPDKISSDYGFCYSDIMQSKIKLQKMMKEYLVNVMKIKSAAEIA